MGKVTNEEKPVASFVVSLVAGILILAGSVMMVGFAFGPSYYGAMMGGSYGMMNGYYGMMQAFGFSGWFYSLMLIGVASGAIVLLGAMMVYTQPSKSSAWGVLILVFSIVSFFGMGGFFLGAILGIVGGTLALTYRQL